MPLSAIDTGLFLLVGKLPDPVLVADHEHRCLYANAAAAQLLGVPPEQVVGDLLDELISPAPHAEATNWPDLVSGSTHSASCEVRRRDGSRRQVELTAVADIVPQVHFWILRDLTERHQAQRERVQLQRVAELALSAGRMGSWVWNLQTGVFRWNQKMLELFGLSTDEVTGQYQTFVNRIHPDDADRVRQVVSEALRSGTHYDIEYRVALSDGTIRWVADRGQVLFATEGEKTGISGVCWDVTPRRLLEQERADHIRELARSNVALQRFAHLASHDLKEPLRNICAFSELLVERSKDKLDEDEQELLELIASSAKRMSDLIDSMLAYSKVGLQRDVVLVLSDASELLERALDNLRTAIKQTGAIVTSGPLPYVRCSPLDIVQLFQNLIGNAIKYSRQVPVVTVSCSTTPAGWTFSVTDGGIGIKAAHCERIFDMFTRLHGSEFAGTGAGLAICKAIVEKHAGNIWVESEEGKGSTFFFSLPA